MPSFSDEAISTRRTAYALCFGEAADKRRIAVSVGDLENADYWEKRMWLLSWAKHIMFLYPLSTETCKGQYIPDYTTVCCAMQLADRCCAYCECTNTPVQPPFNCYIAPDFTAIPVDASFYGSELPGVNYFIISNALGLSNPWTTHIGDIVVDTTNFTPVNNYQYVEDPVTNDLWTVVGGVPGPLYPLIEAIELIDGDYVLSSAYPHINAGLNRTILVEGSTDQQIWTQLYLGNENVFANSQYASMAVGANFIRVTYRYGICNDGPFEFRGVPNAEIVQFTSTAGGTFVNVSMRTTTGYLRCRDWSGNEFVFGNGVPGNNIVVNIPIPTTGPFSGNANKPVYAWAVSGPNGIDPVGPVTHFIAPNKSLSVLDFTLNPGILVVNAPGNYFTQLPFSPLAAPTTVIVNNCLLTSIAVPGTALNTLYAQYNDLTSINVLPNINLIDLNVEFNNLTSIDLSANTALQYLTINSNPLTALDVSTNVALISLFANNCPIGTLDVSNNTLLVNLQCSFCFLLNLDVSNNPNLQTIYCNNNLLPTLDVTSNVSLRDLYCQYNPYLTTVDVSLCPSLRYLNCQNCVFTTLDVTANAGLRYLYCQNNSIAVLDITSNIILQELNCSNNQIAVLDPTNCPLLANLRCNDNQITALDVSGCPVLFSLRASDNLLTSLNTTGCTILNTLIVSSNPLGSVSLSTNTALSILSVAGCGLTALAVPGTAISSVDASNNSLTILVLANRPLLNQLYVNNNPTLVQLYFISSPVFVLGVVGNTALNFVLGQNSTLNATSVDALFSPLNPAAPGVIAIDAGSSAAPTAASAAQRAALVAGGWTIITN